MYNASAQIEHRLYRHHELCEQAPLKLPPGHSAIYWDGAEDADAYGFAAGKFVCFLTTTLGRRAQPAGSSGIIYCLSRGDAEGVATHLRVGQSVLCCLLALLDRVKCS